MTKFSTKYKVVEKDNELAVHALFDCESRAEKYIEETIPEYVSKGYFMDKTLTKDSFKIIPPNLQITRLENWEIREDSDCENYVRAKQWSLENGYKLRDDVSYNGFIVIEKKFCFTTDPMDGHSLEIKVHKDTVCTNRKYHSYWQSDMDAEFGNIMDATKYRLKRVTNQKRASYGDKDLEVVLRLALEREKELTEQFLFYLKGL